MIAHVAEAGEQRGRVVLQLTAGEPNTVAIEAAIRVAKAFHSEIESLFIEDMALFELASFPFAREISLSGRERREISVDGIERQMRHLAAAIGRQVSELARLAEVPLRQTVVRGEPVSALAHACAECGPWNVIAVGHSVGSAGSCSVRDLFTAIADTTGVILAGPNARRTTGPLLVVLEDINHLEPMLRAAERLRLDPDEHPINLLLVAETEEKSQWMEGQARLILGDSDGAAISRAAVAEGAEAALIELIRRMHAGFAIGKFGGVLAPAESDLRPLMASLECPLFLMR
jgi:hypothetical protein